MVYRSVKLDATFAALADPTRRAILVRLSNGERTISELAGRFEMTLPGVSKHIRVLQAAGLATVRKEGRVRHARLIPKPMRGAAEWIDHYRRFWESELEQLATYVEGRSLQEQIWPANPPKLQSPRNSKSAVRSRRRNGAFSTRGRSRKS